MPVHNAQPYLCDAVESIVGQALRDLEFIVIDDGSTDSSLAMLRSYADGDARVKLFSQPNVGISRSLNRAIALATGPYIARMDADDVSVPSRLERQVAYLEAHSDVGLLGTAYHTIDSLGNELATHVLPQTDTAIRWQMLFHNAFCHTSVMFRTALVKRGGGGYDESLRYAQDYDLWAKLLRRAKAANLPEPLVRRRVHGGSIGSTRRQEQQCSATEVAARQIRELIPDCPLGKSEIAALRGWYAHLPRRWGSDEAALCRTLLQVLAAFGRQRIADPEVVRQLRARWLARILGVALTRRPGVLRESGVLEAMRPDDVLPVVKELGRMAWKYATL